MAKKSVTFVCNTCGAQYSSWVGRCSQCGEWNSLVEQLDISTATTSIKKAGRALQPQDLKATLKSKEARLTSGIEDVDSVLGGGLVAGSVVLIAGQPGIGKSTLLLQLSSALASNYEVLYVSGEESAHQVGMRAERLKAKGAHLKLVTSTNTNDIAATIASGSYKVVVVDSIQTIACEEISSTAGTVSQITNSTQLLTMAAKQTNTALILVGHVTKEGSIAGPKVLEHVVDVVLQLEGDRYGGFKLLRAVKNRFGSTNEVGIFDMEDSGLKPVANPSAALLEERQVTDGSIVLATVEGTRAILVEVQALVNKTSYGYPKRTAVGFELNRLNLLIATLERRTKLSLADQDVYIKIVGGMKITEPAADLAICMAIASAARGMQLKKNVVVFGEVGLSGEVRHVPLVEKRLSEAEKLGFVAALGPRISNKKTGTFLVQVPDVRTALNTFLEKES